MRIQVWDYREELREEHAEILAAIERVLQSGRLILGESGRLFEEEFARYCGVRHGIGVNSGTDAIELALIALGIQDGDEVVTVSNTAIPTVSAIVSVGAVPRFVDIDPATYLMDVSQLERAMTPRTRCIVPVHLFGQCVDMDPILEIAARHELKVLEDCAQSHGARYKGRIAGSMGHAAAFSFYPTKILGAYGDAGMVLTNDDDLAARLRRLRFYGIEKTYYAVEHGYNSRLDELHAEILRTKLRRIDSYIARRRALAQRYDRLLADSPLTRPQTPAGNDHAFYLYVARHPARDRIIEELARDDIHVNVNYPWPVHTMTAYRSLGYREGDFPMTEAAAKEIFSLPMYPALTDAEQDTVCECLRRIVAKV